MAPPPPPPSEEEEAELNRAPSQGSPNSMQYQILITGCDNKGRGIYQAINKEGDPVRGTKAYSPEGASKLLGQLLTQFPGANLKTEPATPSLDARLSQQELTSCRIQQLVHLSVRIAATTFAGRTTSRLM